MESLRDKTLVMIVGPTAIGKSTLMHEVARLDSRFGYVQSFVTRPMRSGETSTYRHISQDEAKSLREAGKAVTYFEHPTTRVIYGTTVGSFTHRFNLLDTLSGTVDRYRSLPFEHTVTISLTADPDAWTGWLAKRFPDMSEDRTKRLREAIGSIEWSLAQTHDHHWVVNTSTDLTAAAEQIIAIASSQNSARATNAPPEAGKLLERAKSLLSYE